MEQVDYESARKKFDEGYDCIGRLNESGKAAVAAFAGEFYAGASYDLNAVYAQVELASSRLMIPCGSPLMPFAREADGKTMTQNFRLLPVMFDWFVR
ncbi:MAG: hypothetical protein H6R01_383 [Burkholderiaceae bacterium]|nr:hypothetical protein [Burkholderiaceae bacterium]